MMRILRLLLAFVALLALIAFAVANREAVEVSFAPFPWQEYFPIWGVFLFGLVLGVLIGGIGVWLGGHRHRREARRSRGRIWALENQLNVIKQQQERAEAERYAHGRALAGPRAAAS